MITACDPGLKIYKVLNICVRERWTFDLTLHGHTYFFSYTLTYFLIYFLKYLVFSSLETQLLKVLCLVGWVFFYCRL